jgi:hypothetical protein
MIEGCKTGLFLKMLSLGILLHSGNNSADNLGGRVISRKKLYSSNLERTKQQCENGRDDETFKRFAKSPDTWNNACSAIS